MIRYNQVAANISLLPNFISAYERELSEAKMECSIAGLVEKNLKELPGITEHRFNQLQEIDALLTYMNLELRKIKQKHYKLYLEKYNKALTSRDAEKYSLAEDEVIDYEVLINELALLRNKYLGITKAFESKGFQLNAIVKIRTAGMDDITI